MRWWIDTDPGVDDALAILVATVEAGGDVVGFSTVHGNRTEPRVARNLVRLLDAIRRKSLEPEGWEPVLARGSAASLAGDVPAEKPSWYHGEDGLGEVTWALGPGWERRYDELATEAIVDACSRGPTSLLCLGPLTNVALAVRREPDLVHRVERVVIMGGSFRAGGNESIAAEFNFLADPEAAALVLEAGFPSVEVVPLDACDDVPLRAKEWRALSKLRSSAGSLAAELTSHWRDEVKVRPGIGLYDLVTWLVTSDPGLATWEDAYVAVDTGSGIGRGASFADWRGVTGTEPNARIATGIPEPETLFERARSLLRGR